MSAILLAATQRDGHQAMRLRQELIGDVHTIVTPRTKDRARGLVAGHVYLTEAFAALPLDEREPVEEVVRPCLATSACGWCRDGEYLIAVPTTQGSVS